MNNTYCKFMDQQHLSEETKQAFYNNLQHNDSRPRHAPFLKAAIVVACILLMIPISVYAIENIFGISVVKIKKGNTSTGKLATGYEVNYPDLVRRQLSDFPEEIQTMEDYRLVVYDSWEQAEEELGITLINNSFLSDEKVTKEYAYDLRHEGVFKRLHCFGQYNGLDNQFYRATITAAYRYDNMVITIRSCVTCEHPAISAEEANQMHWSEVMYADRDVEEISQEQYLAANGINATIVTIERTGSKSTKYDATFSANGASYKITIKAFDPNKSEEAKENLIKILEGFSFD